MAEPSRQDPDQPPPSRADWLVGAEDGVEAEHKSRASGHFENLQRPKLVRPDAGQPPPAGLEVRPQRVPAPPPADKLPGLADTPVTPAWDTGRSSVPMPHIERGDMFAAAPAPEAAREFPMDDAEERSRVAAERAEMQAEEDAIAARPHAVVRPAEFEMPAPLPPWWTRMPELLAVDRRLQIALVAALLAFGAYTFWPRAEKTTSVGHLRHHPERYADTQVKVNGRVSEVFPVGGSWAYTLVQGRDTIVVFTRWRQPKRQDRLTVVGTLSNGFLDGQSRVAIFEATP